MSFRRRVVAVYGRIWRTYRGSAPAILLLAAVVFLPLGLLDALTTNVEIDALNVTNGIKVAAILVAVGAVTTTGLIGEVFFSGAIAISLSHRADEHPPGLREIAGRLNYGRLIAVDLIFVATIVVGLLLGALPGLLAFVWLGLAGPVVELEGRSARGALLRSVRLVRGNFWLVFWVLVPVELLGEAISELLSAGIHAAAGESFVATWLGEAAANIALSPVFALAAALLTIQLIGERRSDPPVHSAPMTA